jgi:hypothetical protein
MFVEQQPVHFAELLLGKNLQILQIKMVTLYADFDPFHDFVDVAFEDLLEVNLAERDVCDGQVFEVSIYFIEFDVKHFVEFIVCDVFDFETAYFILNEEVNFDEKYSKRCFLFIRFETSLQLILRMLIQLPLLLLIMILPKHSLNLQRRINPLHFLSGRRVKPIIHKHSIFGMHIGNDLLVNSF